MVVNPGLLVARVFKQRYCRDKDLLEATAKNGCSFVWRSIIGSKGVLEAGARWKVGNRDNIKLYEEEWVEGSQVTKLKGKEGTVDGLRRVGTLMREEGGWDIQMVDSLFHEFEREAILNMECGMKEDNDRRRWRLESNGKFSVKSCYLAQMGLYTQHEHRSKEDCKVWSRLVWQVSIPPKARVFMWRACFNAIPTMGNLHDHHFPVEGTCVLCRDRWATTEHVLFFCPKIRGTWKASRFWQLLKGGITANFVDIAIYMEKELEVDEYAVWCVMVWKIWSFICEVVYGERGTMQVPREEDSWAIWESFQKAKIVTGMEMGLGVSRGERKWTRPPEGVIRVDVDAMYNEQMNRFGVGIIL